MEHLTPLNPFYFWMQVIILIFYIPASYIAYAWSRAPLKRYYNRLALLELGVDISPEPGESQAETYITDISPKALYYSTQLDFVDRRQGFRQYFWPILLATMLVGALYSLTHPYILQFGVWRGINEEIIDVFGSDEAGFPRVIPVGRYLFWGWLGAYVYSYQLIFRRFLNYDLTPSVYIYTANRFWLAMVIGSIVALSIGFFTRVSSSSFELSLLNASIAAFFIGFFPERGIDWIVTTAKKILKQQGGVAKEIRLSEVEGLSIWHQGRLRQEGIENVQNLATADIPSLVIGTPFTVNQIADWVDQAILLRNTSNSQFNTLSEIGIITATDFLTNTKDNEQLKTLASAIRSKNEKEKNGLSEEELQVLRFNLRSALNMKLISRFRWKDSMDTEQVKDANILDKLHSQVVVVEESALEKV